MKKVLFTFFVLIFIGFSSAQITSLWEFSAANSNMPSWFGTANTERGLAYGYVGGSHLIYVVSRNGGTFVQILNGETGVTTGVLDVTGISGGTFALNDIEVTEDGIIYGCNLVNDLAGVFKIYRWSSNVSAPTVAFFSDFGVLKRMGDNFTVTGSASDNSAKIWFCDATNNKVYMLGTSDNGNTFTITLEINLPAGTFGGAPSVFPLLEISVVIVNSSGKHVTAWGFDDSFIDEIPGGIISTATTSTKFFSLNLSGYVAAFQYSTNNVRVVGDAGQVPTEHLRTYVISPTLGANPNLNGTGDIAIRYLPEEGKIILYVLATNNGLGAYQINTPFIMNGRFNEKYNWAADKQNSNLGFGPNIDINRLFYGFNNDTLYIAVESKLNLASSDGILLFLGVSSLAGTGVPAGTSLGGVTGGGHAFGDASNPNFKMGFETNFAFALNPGADDTLVYVDAVKYYNSVKTGSYLGAANQYGSPTAGPSAAGIFSPNSVVFAYDTAFGYDRGFEIAIPFSELGNLTSNGTIRLFAVVGSSTAYFSDVTVPGNLTTGNPGFNPNFNTLPGGPYYTQQMNVPVELASFTADVSGFTVELNWITSTETNNRGFEIERMENDSWQKVAFVNGAGTSTEITNYSFSDDVSSLNANVIRYRLKQIDYNGTYTYSNEIEVNTNPIDYALYQNYPNPFNPVTTIKYSVPAAGHVNLTVYDVLGNKVTELVNTVKSAGTYNALFSTSTAGGGLASGVYYCKMTGGNHTKVIKLILMK